MALRFLMATLARTTEVRLATFGEIEGDVWSLEAAGTKADTARRIPPVPQAVKVVKACRRLSPYEYLFLARRIAAKVGRVSLPPCPRGRRWIILNLSRMSPHTRHGCPRSEQPGRVNWKTVPRRGFGVNVSVPPCASTIERQIDRPMPRPCDLVV